MYNNALSYILYKLFIQGETPYWWEIFTIYVGTIRVIMTSGGQKEDLNDSVKCLCLKNLYKH